MSTPLDKVRGKKGKGKAKPKGKTTAAVETSIHLIGQLVTGTGAPVPLIGGKRRGGGRGGYIGKTMRPMGGRKLGL